MEEEILQSIDNKLGNIEKQLNTANEFLAKIFALFSKYDNSYSEEVIRENHINV